MQHFNLLRVPLNDEQIAEQSARTFDDLDEQS